MIAGVAISSLGMTRARVRGLFSIPAVGSTIAFRRLKE
jgi:hypothetical protein